MDQRSCLVICVGDEPRPLKWNRVDVTNWTAFSASCKHEGHGWSGATGIDWRIYICMRGVRGKGESGGWPFFSVGLVIGHRRRRLKNITTAWFSLVAQTRRCSRRTTRIYSWVYTSSPIYYIIIIIIIYLLKIVIDNRWQYVCAVEQDKKAQSALTIALKDTYTTVMWYIHTGLQCICTIKVQRQL